MVSSVISHKRKLWEEDQFGADRPALLLEWYDRHRRCLPWRPVAGERADPYRVWRALPGIGPYTAAAIAAIAFGRRTMPVDGNIERVVSRLFAVEEPLPQAKPLIQQWATTLLRASRAGDERSRAGDSAQALMD